MELYFNGELSLPKQRSRVFKRMEYVQQGIEENISRISDYRKNNNRVVRSNHPLVKIIRTLPVDFDINYRYYYDKIVDIYNDYLTALGLWGSYKKGRTYSGVFYGGECLEVLLADDQPAPSNLETIAWNKLSPVRVLRHDNLNLNHYTPELCWREGLVKYAVIYIDVPLLMVQYRKWLEYQMRLPDEERDSIRRFVYQYPLTNMISSHVTITLANRFAYLHDYGKIEPMKMLSALALVDYSSKLDEAQREILKDISSGRVTISEITYTLQLIYGQTFADLIELPDFLPTRIINWLLLWSTTPYVGLISAIYRETRSTRDKGAIKNALKFLRRYETDNMYQMVPEPIKKPLDYELFGIFLNFN